MYIPIGPHIEIDRDLHSVRKDGKEVRLTGLEYGLLEYLSRHADRICSRAEILYSVWGQRFQYDTGTVDVHLNALRRKLGFSKTMPIEAIRGVGLIYRSQSGKTTYTIDRSEEHTCKRLLFSGCAVMRTRLRRTDSYRTYI